MRATRRLVETSLLVVETLAQVWQTQPELWITPPQAWDPESLALVNKIAEFFKVYESRLGITGATEALLRKFLKPHFFTTENHRQLITQVGQRWQPEESQSASKSIGVILLDADNQTLDIDKEQWLQEVTETAVNYRFAFANWKNRNSDIDLKKRGYYLFHAPAGDDMADGLMIAFASTFPQHYAEVGRIFVCSNDRTFDTLVATLPKYGVTCYRVIQPNRHRLRIHDYQAGTTYDYQPPIPEKNEFIQQLIGLARDLQKADHPWIPMTTLMHKYEDKYGLSIREIIQKRAGDHSSLTTFLKSMPHEFVIHSIQGKEYLCPFMPPPVTRLTPPQSVTSEMIEIIHDLLRSQGKMPGEYVSPGLITSGYNAQFGHGILEALRQRGLVANLRVFISQQPSYFDIKGGNNGQWEVAYLSQPASASPPPFSDGHP